jgi:hypothetical protein
MIPPQVIYDENNYTFRAPTERAFTYSFSEFLDRSYPRNVVIFSTWNDGKGIKLDYSKCDLLSSES